MMMLPIIAFFTHKCISLTVNIKPPFPIPVQAMQAYIDAGLTTFDMADIYGPAEEIFGHFNSQVWIVVVTYTTQTPDYEPVGLKVYVHIVDCMNIDLRSVCKWSSTPELAQEGANVAQLLFDGWAAQSRSQESGERWCMEDQ